MTRLQLRSQVFQWTTNPLLQALCFLVLGKVVFDSLSPGIEIITLCFLLLVLFGSMLIWSDWVVEKSGKSIQILRQISFWLSFAGIGMGLAAFQSDTQTIPANTSFLCRIDENFGSNGPEKIRCQAFVEKIKTNKGWQNYDGKVLLQFSGIGNQTFQNGDRILVGKELSEIEKPSIPGQFDAKKYYNRKGIGFQVFVSANDFSSAGQPDPNRLVYFSHQIRFWMENKINQLSIEPDDGFMLSALVLGIRRKIDPELKSAYSAAGVTHILAVSGMHVGLIFVFLTTILGWVKRFQYGQTAFSVMVIGLLWLYAMVTGLSPSVLRAVTIFTIIQIGELLKKPGLPINGLCLGTIILFLLDVEIVYDVGYQLSFAAVYGILSFDKPIKELVSFKNKVLRFFWESTSITISATLATFPLIVYYFHQFPVYFLMANLVAVPVSNGLIYCGIALILTSFLPGLAHGVAWVIHFLIFCLNQFVLWIAGLPFSTLDQIYIPNWAIFLLLGFLVFLQLWILRTKYKMLVYSLFFLLLYSIGILGYQIYLWKRPQVNYAFRTKKDWMIASLQGRTAQLTLLASDTSKGQNSFEIKSLREGFHLHQISSFCKKGIIISQSKKDDKKKSILVVESGKRFLFLGNYLKMDTTIQQKLPVDFLIVQQAGFKTIENALKGIEPKEIWVDWNERTLKNWSALNHSYKVVNFRANRFQTVALN